MSWVVVLLTVDQCPEYGGTRCVMEAHGPFDSNAEAKAYMVNVPNDLAPHAVLLNEPMQSLLL